MSNWWLQPWDEMSEPERLAAKLADAGPSENEALAWVYEIMAEVWSEGHRAGWRNALTGPVRTNPYRKDDEVDE